MSTTNASQRSYKALSGVVHDAQLKPLLVLEGFGERAAKSVGGQNFLAAVLELSEYTLQNEGGGRHVERVRRQEAGPGSACR